MRERERISMIGGVLAKSNKHAAANEKRADAGGAYKQPISLVN